MLERAHWGMSLYARGGARKYVNTEERVRFLAAARRLKPETRTLCMTLVYTGCRISEALALTALHIQPYARVVSFRTLKKRGLLVVREVPVPGGFITALDDIHHIAASFPMTTAGAHKMLWPWCRTTAWQRVKDVMKAAGIAGAHATPKGLRHGFGVHAVQSGVPLNLVQKWLGHAQLSTTAIYADAVGPEEHAIAERMWSAES